MMNTTSDLFLFTLGIIVCLSATFSVSSAAGHRRVTAPDVISLEVLKNKPSLPLRSFMWFPRRKRRGSNSVFDTVNQTVSIPIVCLWAFSESSK